MSTLDRPRPTTTAASPSALAPLSDSALANLIAHGRDGAFEVLYERYRTDLSRYCRALLRNPEDAEEAFQGTMLNALRALRSGDGGRNMRPWLYRIAHNQCASMIRARRPSSALSPDQPSPADLPEDQVARAEQIRHLRTDLGSLPALQRSALVMREMSGLSHRAIAQALSVEPADARQLVYEARRSLDECRIGRESGCSDLRAQIADGDRRRLRSRRVRAHLRTCDDCTAYVASQDERRRGYAALAPAIPAAAGRQVFDRVMGSSGAGAATGGAAVVGVPGGVAGTIAGLAAGLSPANSARAWARLPDSTATGLAGAGATAGIALLSLALTALLLSGDNAAHGSAAGPPAPDRSSAPLEVAVAAPPGAASIGYRAAFADRAPAIPAADAGTGSPSDAVDEPAPTDPISIAIEGAVIEERPAPTPPPSDPEPSFEAGFEIVDLPAEGPQRPNPSSPRPPVVDPAPPAEPTAPAAPVTTTVVEAPAEAEPPPPALGSEDPEPASVAEAPVDPEFAAPDAVGSAPDPEPIADPARDGVDASTADAEEESVPDPKPDAVSPDPEVGSIPDPEPTYLGDEGEAAAGVEVSAVRDESDEEYPRDIDSEDVEAPGSEPEVGSGPDPEPEAGSTSTDEIAFDGDFAVECPVDPAT